MAHAHNIVSAIPEVPITELRKPPPAEKLEEALGDAGQPRANRAVTVERPEGTPGSPENRSVLQSHVDFFDTDKDGIIYPWDTYKGDYLRPPLFAPPCLTPHGEVSGSYVY